MQRQQPVEVETDFKNMETFIKQDNQNHKIHYLTAEKTMVIGTL